MAMLDVVYTHAKDPDFPGCRRKTVQEMHDYIDGLIFDLRMGGISVKYEFKEGDHNDVTINGKSVATILDELGSDIRVPEVGEDDVRPVMGLTDRGPKDWNKEVIEDISDLLMKNAFSKAFADARKNSIKTV